MDESQLLDWKDCRDVKMGTKGNLGKVDRIDTVQAPHVSLITGCQSGYAAFHSKSDPAGLWARITAICFPVKLTQSLREWPCVLTSALRLHVYDICLCL